MAMARGGGGFVIAALVERIVAKGSSKECDILNKCLTGFEVEVEGSQTKGIRGSSALSKAISLLRLKVGDDK